jgi:hypothetical protein
MSHLNKTKFIVEKSEVLGRLDDSAIFEIPNDDNIHGFARHGIVIDKKVWLELGCPTVMTVTVEPGDTMNEEGDSVN